MNSTESLKTQFSAAADARGLNDTKLCRIFNVSLALLALLVLSPIMLVAALLVRLTSKGPVLYKGKRVGKHLREFEMYKFRTLEIGAEEKIGARLVKPNDPYFTPIGRFLKRSRIDEFPQLFNVIRGDMNLVGPRPVRPVFLSRYLAEMPQYGQRFLVRPGMTCISHVSGGFYSPVHQRLRHDLLYIQKRSLWLDVQILFWTTIKVLGRWVQPTLFLLCFFLFASYFPPALMAHFYIRIAGEPYNVFYLLAAAVFGILLGRQIQLSRFVLYRTPLNWFIPAFAVLGILNVLHSSHRFATLRGNGFLWITGIIPAFVIVHSKISGRRAAVALQVAALGSGGLALLGLAAWAVAVLEYLGPLALFPSGQSPLGPGPRAVGFYTEPIVFASYIVMGLPLLLLLTGGSSNRFQRTVYTALALLGILAIVLSQSRSALAALLVSGPLCLWKFSHRWTSRLALGLCAVLMLLWIYVPGRFNSSSLLVEARAHLQEGTQVLSVLKPSEFLWGAGAKATEDKTSGRPFLASIANLPLRFFVEYGAIGILLMAGLFAEVLRLCFVQGRHMGGAASHELWAVGSSIVGFLIVSNGFAGFYQISTQLLIWGLIGLACGIFSRQDRRPGARTIWRIKKHGDDFTVGKLTGTEGM